MLLLLLLLQLLLPPTLHCSPHVAILADYPRMPDPVEHMDMCQGGCWWLVVLLVQLLTE